MFVCGISLIIEELLDIFTRIFLLRIDAVTQENRLVAHDLARPPGRTEAGRQEIRVGRSAFENHMLRLGAVPIDGPNRSTASQTTSSSPSDNADRASRTGLWVAPATGRVQETEHAMGLVLKGLGWVPVGCAATWQELQEPDDGEASPDREDDSPI